MNGSIMADDSISPATFSVSADSIPVRGNRTAFLDHIRIFLTVLVIMHHAAITYGAPGGWYYREVEYGQLTSVMSLFFVLLASVDQSFFMGFFFLIAGYFTPVSLRRKGMGGFVRGRLVRLGIPLLLFAGLLGPLTIGIGEAAEGRSFIGGFYWVYVMGNYHCGPLWFVQALLIFSLLYVLWTKWRPADAPVVQTEPVRLPAHSWLLGAALLTGVAAFLLRLHFPAGQNYLGMQLGYFASYVVLFCVGCRAARDHWLERVTLRYALPWVIVAVLATASMPIAAHLLGDTSHSSGGWNFSAGFYAMWEPFVAWGVILGLLYVTRRFLSGTNRFLKRLARDSYAVYVIHAPVLVGVSRLATGWDAAPLVKWLCVGAVSCACAWVLAEVLVRMPGLRKVF